jgi:hypothetical protein
VVKLFPIWEISTITGLEK